MFNSLLMKNISDYVTTQIGRNSTTLSSSVEVSICNNHIYYIIWYFCKFSLRNRFRESGMIPISVSKNLQKYQG